MEEENGWQRGKGRGGGRGWREGRGGGRGAERRERRRERSGEKGGGGGGGSIAVLVVNCTSILSLQVGLWDTRKIDVYCPINYVRSNGSRPTVQLLCLAEIHKKWTHTQVGEEEEEGVGLERVYQVYGSL